MNVFEEVKRSVTARQAAEFYGIRVSRNGMALCPFHDDRHPSMKVDRRFHCFGCLKDGDVIDLTASLFSIPPKEAALKLAEDFSVSIDEQPPRGRRRPAGGAKRSAGGEERLDSGMKRSEGKRFVQTERKCVEVYSSYLCLLDEWRKQYAPETPEEEWDTRFIEALDNTARVEHKLDTLLFGTPEEKAEVMIGSGKEVLRLEGRLRELITGYEGSPAADSG